MPAMTMTASRPGALAASPVCATLGRDELCLPCELARGDRTAVPRRRVRRNTVLHFQGQDFTAAYLVRSGSFKTLVHGEAGNEHVVGFHVGAEAVGFDGLARHRYEATAVALEDSEVLVLPLAEPEWWSGAVPDLQHAVARFLGREILRERERGRLLAHRSADARLGSFLLEMARRMQARGWSGTEFHLRMTRGDIGSYLGLQLETVSRTFTRLRRERLLEVRGRHVRLLDTARLERAVVSAHST